MLCIDTLYILYNISVQLFTPYICILYKSMKYQFYSDNLQDFLSLHYAGPCSGGGGGSAHPN